MDEITIDEVQEWFFQNCHNEGQEAKVLIQVLGLDDTLTNQMKLEEFLEKLRQE